MLSLNGVTGYVFETAHPMTMNFRRPSAVFHSRFMLRTSRPTGLTMLSMGWSMRLGRM